MILHTKIKNYDKEFYSPSKELYMQIKKQNSKPKKMIISNGVEHNINEKRIFNPEIDNEVSDMRTLYPKENVEWLNWINQGKLIYGDKEKLQALIAQQRMNVAEVNSQVVQSPLYEHCLESSSNILDKFGEIKDILLMNTRSMKR